MGRSQRHMILEQGSDAHGSAIGQGAIAPGFMLQLEDPEFGKELEGVALEVPVGPDGGPLQGSTLTGPIPSDLPDPTPVPPPDAAIVITSPTEGATVPPIHDVIGTGANPGGEVQLWYAGQDPGEDEPAATTTADGSGNWGFTGDTPAAIGQITWGVYSDNSLATVNITVEEEPEARMSEREAGPFNITNIEDHPDGLAVTLDGGVFKAGDDVLIEATGNTDVNGAYEILSANNLTIVVPSDYALSVPIIVKGRLTITGAVD